MQGYHKFLDLVVSIVYYTKNVYYLIMVSSDLMWVFKEKDVFNVDMGRTDTLGFHGLIQFITTTSPWGV